MEYVRFGNTGMQVSRFALGAMLIGRKMDLKQSGKVLDDAMDAGVNFIDTAESYGDSEQFLGQLLKDRRERVYLATKLHRMRARDGKTGRNSRANIAFCLEQSLRRLQTDHLDLYQLHHPDQSTPLQETMSALDQAVRQGKVRYVGVSNHFAWQMAWMLGESRAHHWEPIVSVQSAYSLFDRTVEPEIAPFCSCFNIAMMVYSPLCGGVLTGKYQRDQSPPDGSRAQRDWVSQGHLADSRTFDVLDQLQAVAVGLNLSIAQLAVLWLKAKPYATTLLLGGSRPEHYRPLYEVADRSLPVETVTALDELTKSWRYRAPINAVDEPGPPQGLQW